MTKGSSRIRSKRVGWVTLVTIAIIGWTLIELFYWPIFRISAPPVHPFLIMHGGGEINGYYGSNSLEALDSNYQKGSRYFELDFNQTQNGDLVAIHDWQAAFTSMLGEKKSIPNTAEEFVNLKTKTGHTLLNLQGVKKWLETHPDATIITDIKERNISSLRRISHSIGDLTIQVIPQIYSFEEYEPVVAMGFNKVIFTSYRSKQKVFEIVRFASNVELFAVTIPFSRAMKQNFAARLNRTGTPTYAHTVNHPEKARELMNYGVTGFYTDSLTEEAIAELRSEPNQ